MSNANLLALAKLPTHVLRSALDSVGSTTALDKPGMIRALSECIKTGALTLAAIEAFGSAPVTRPRPATPAPAAAPDLSKVEAAISSIERSLTSMKSRDDAIESSVNGTINDVIKSVVDTRGEMIDRLSDLGTALSGVVGRVDKLAAAPTVDASAAVAAAVEAAFGPFRAAVEAAGAQEAVVAAIPAAPVGTATVEEVFGIRLSDHKGRPLTVSLWGHPDAPAVDPDFVWSEGILRHLVLSERNGDPLWFGGEKGTGKSETARQWAARTGRAFTRINFHRHTATEEYLGATGLKAGETVFEPQAFLSAYTTPSAVILLDEVTNADPGELAPLNGLLEPSAAVTIGGTVWRKAPGVMIFAADNTLGNGDESGRYVGTRQQNAALVDRFARVIPFRFMPEAQEAAAIVNRTGCSPRLAEHVVSLLTVCRQKVQSGDLIDAPSIRSALAFIRSVDVLSVDEAWETCVVARQPSEGRAALDVIKSAYLDAAFINSLI